MIAAGNVEALKLVPGVGQKTGARLLLELQARFDYLGADGALGNGRRQSEAARLRRAEVGEALVELGYGPDEVRRRAASPAGRRERRGAAACGAACPGAAAVSAS